MTVDEACGENSWIKPPRLQTKWNQDTRKKERDAEEIETWNQAASTLHWTGSWQEHHYYKKRPKGKGNWQKLRGACWARKYQGLLISPTLHDNVCDDLRCVHIQSKKMLMPRLEDYGCLPINQPNLCRTMEATESLPTPSSGVEFMTVRRVLAPCIRWSLEAGSIHAPSFATWIVAVFMFAAMLQLHSSMCACPNQLVVIPTLIICATPWRSLDSEFCTAAQPPPLWLTHELCFLPGHIGMGWWIVSTQASVTSTYMQLRRE